VQKDQRLLAWAIGISMVGHCLGMIGSGYFEQHGVLLYLNFAFVGFIYEISTSPSAEGQLSLLRNIRVR